MISARSADRTGVRGWFFASGLSLLLIVSGCRRESPEGPRASGTESTSAPSDNVLSFGRTFPMLPDAAASREALTKSLREADAQVSASPDDAAPLLNRGRVKSRLAWFLSPQEKLRLTDEAEADFERAAQLSAGGPGAAAACVELARLRLGQYRFAEAVPLCMQAESADPQSPEVRALKAVLAAMGSGEWQACIERLKALAPELEKSESSIKAEVFLARALQFSGQHEEAEPVYRKVLEQDPHDWSSWNNLALVVQEAGRTDEAQAIQERLLPGGQGDLLGANNLAVTLNTQGKNQEALRILDEVLSLAPGFPAAWLNRGVVLDGLGRHEEALESYEQATRLLPTYWDAHRNRAWSLMILNRPSEAVEVFKRLTSVDPADIRALGGLGDSLYQCGRWREAADAYRLLIKALPEDPDARNGLGASLIELGDFDAAEPLLQEAVRLRPDFASAWHNLGLIAQKRSKPDEAIAAFRQAVAADPNFAPALSKLRDVLLAQGRKDEAVAEIQTVLKRAPANPLAHLALANTYYSIGLLPETVAALTAALQLGDDADLYLQRGARLIEMGRHDRALPDIRQAYDLSMSGEVELCAYAALFLWAHQDEFPQRPDADPMLRAVRAKLQDKDWPARLVDLALGATSAEAVLAAAESDGHRCEAWYYAGESKRLAGDRSAAETCYRSAVAVSLPEYYEYQFARRRLSAAP